MADTQAPPATGQAVNGQGPAPTEAEAPCEDCASGSEKFMGALGIAAAAFLAFVGIDLLTGGALSRVLFSRGGDDDAAG